MRLLLAAVLLLVLPGCPAPGPACAATEQYNYRCTNNVVQVCSGVYWGGDINCSTTEPASLRWTCCAIRGGAGLRACVPASACVEGLAEPPSDTASSGGDMPSESSSGSLVSRSL